jgi:hypothetical protein
LDFVGFLFKGRLLGVAAWAGKTSMGQTVSRQKCISPEFLKPQGLYSNNKDIDLKRLKRHILEKKLAPCYKGCDNETAEVRIVEAAFQLC